MASYHVRGSALHRFRWLGPGAIPQGCDLRQSGWILEEAGEPSTECIILAQASEPDGHAWGDVLTVPQEVRRFILVVGAADAHERAALLKDGFGEAVSCTIEPGEFEARASRLAELTRWLPRHRRLGDLELDLLARKAYGFGKPMNLNPREFALLWRLSDTPGETVTKQDLLHDVWRLGFMPETNSIAVHMSRLRRKLEFVGLTGAIATASAGGYCLALSDSSRAAAARFPQCGAPRRHTVLAAL